jgi:hypothetical protein
MDVAAREALQSILYPRWLLDDRHRSEKLRSCPAGERKITALIAPFNYGVPQCLHELPEQRYFVNLRTFC